MLLVFFGFLAVGHLELGGQSRAEQPGEGFLRRCFTAAGNRWIFRDAGFWSHIDKSGCPEGYEHLVELFLAFGDIDRGEQASADQIPQGLNLWILPEHCGQKPPGQGTTAREIRRRRDHQFLKLLFVPIRLTLTARGHLLLKLLLGLEQTRIFGVFWDLIVLQFPSVILHVVLMCKRIDEAFAVELGSPSSAKNLLGRGRIDQLLFAIRPFDQTWQDHASGR